MEVNVGFDLNNEQRSDGWKTCITLLEEFYANTGVLPVSTETDRQALKSELVSGFDETFDLGDALNHVVSGLTKHAVHTPHPGYFGLFNPRPNFPSILADAITAGLNPQLAAWSHAPFASEVESLLIREFGKKFGYDSEEMDGVFTSGGAEANLTALLAAINFKYPKFAEDGVHALPRKVRIYCSAESHHTIVKSARICGLGSSSVGYIDVDHKQQMIPAALEQQIAKDKVDGYEPLMIVATTGTTGSGAIDPIHALAKIAARHNCWIHADAAYGGAVVITEKFKHLLTGIENADSITFDAHKWLSVPMATSMFLTKHKHILGQAFRIRTDYMPSDDNEIQDLGSFGHSIQWSRRFIGLKLYLPLLVFGWRGYEQTILHQVNLGKMLKEKLIQNDWTVDNETDLPVLCFSDEGSERDPDFATKVAAKIVKSGKAWVSTYPTGNRMTIRACITNYSTSANELNTLLEALNSARAEARIKTK